MNRIDKLVINNEETLGNLRFKRYGGLIYKYVNQVKTDEVIGFSIIVESLKTYSNFKIKVLNTKTDVSALENTPEKFFDKPVEFNNLTIKPYVSKGYINWTLSASGLRL